MSDDKCPVCQRSRAERYVVGHERCNAVFHTRDKVRKGRRASWRTIDDSTNTTRGEPTLEDQDPEDRVFGGPGKIIEGPRREDDR